MTYTAVVQRELFIAVSDRPHTGVVFELLPLYSWVVPTYEQVEECQRVAWNMNHVGADPRERGAIGALMWVNIGEVSPITQRPLSAERYEAARAECWAALCVAAGQGGPITDDWAQLGIEAAPVVNGDPEYGYGTWRALTWLLGTREEWPLYTGWHQAAEIPMERPHMLVPRSRRDTEAWRLAQLAAEDRAREEALRHWQHVRQRVDA